MSYIETDLNHIRPVFRFRCRMAGRRPGKMLFGGNFIEEDAEMQNDDTIKVVLRLKPSNSDSESVVQILDSKTILYKMPSDLTLSRKKLNIPDECKYTFSNIFQPNITQSELYNGCVASLVKDLFAGQHCLLFTYGTTNAGKTFTVLGTGDQPGIIPRTLTTVFKSIKGKEYGNPRIRPHMFNSALEVNDETLQEENDFKKSILFWNPDKTQQSDSSRLYKTCSSTIASSVDDIIGESVFQEMQKRLTNDTSIVEYEAEAEDRFSVWVSFAEIYNENIFDLLQPVAVNQRRKALKLARDNHSNTYIKGLKHVFVESEEEAYKVLRFGKNNLQVAATSMNSHSSRSHCIFAIKLIKYPNVQNPETVVVSSFSICDLAGAERQKKTLNVGLRLKESQNINCSLHVLSRCFSIIRENQINNESKLIPFRDSKLTQLFQHALQGKENVTMIVNVNPDRHLCEETQHVLKATAVAKQIVVARPRAAHRPQQSTRNSVFSQIITKHNRSTLIRWDSCVKPRAPDANEYTINDDAISVEEAPTELEKKQEDYTKLLALVETLKEQLESAKAKYIQTKKLARQREDEVREEMKAEFEKILEESKMQAEPDMKKGVKNIQSVEGKRGERLILGEPIHPKRPKKEFSSDDEELADKLADLEDQVRQQKLQIDSLTTLVNLKGEENKELAMNYSSLKLQLGFKDREISSLNQKVEIFGEEGDLKTAYVELEKKMDLKVKILENILEDARTDMLEAISQKEDLEEEITSKEAEIIQLRSKIKDMKYEVESKTDTLTLLENNIEEIEEQFNDDIKELERKLFMQEEDIKKKNEELKKLSELSEEVLQVDLVKSDLEKLVSEKKSIEETYLKQSEEFKSYREDFTLKLERLESEKMKMKEEYELDISSRDEEISKLKSKLMSVPSLQEIEERLKSELEEENDAKFVKLVIHNSEENELKIENVKKEYTKKINEKDNIILSLKQELIHSCQAREDIRADLESAKKIVNELQQQTTKQSIQMEELQKQIEVIRLNKEKSDNDHLTEVSTLEKELKQQIQEIAKLTTICKEKTNEVKDLSQMFNKVKLDYEELRRVLRNKEHDLECSRSEIVGYQNSLPTLQTEKDQQRKDNLQLKRRCEDQMEVIYNMEKEKESFKANQIEIIGKYEDQLKKTKEENESLKREVARVTNTFYKSSPTPKKFHDLQKKSEQLQEKCDELTKQLEDLQVEHNKLKEKDSHLSKFAVSKEEPKIKPLRSRTTAYTPNKVYCDSSDSEKSKKENYRKPVRKALLDPTSSYENIQGDDNEMEELCKDSPRKSKRILRTRNKIESVSTSKKSSTYSTLCVGCKDKKPSYRKLFTQNNRILQELNIEDVDFAPQDSRESPLSFVRRTMKKKNK